VSIAPAPTVAEQRDSLRLVLHVGKIGVADTFSRSSCLRTRLLAQAFLMCISGLCRAVETGGGGQVTGCLYDACRDDERYPPPVAASSKGVFLVAPKPLGIPPFDGLRVVGTLGGSALRGVDFELDLAHRKLKVYSQDHCAGGQVVYWTDQYTSVPLLHTRSGAYFFAIELEGKKVYAGLSNSATVTTLGTDVSRALFGFDKSSAGIEETHEADGTTYHYRAMSLTAAGVSMANARIRLVDPVKGCELSKKKRDVARYVCDGIYPMSLGGDLLQQLRMFFATKEGKLYFTSANAGVTQ
jgi:hypothetical protein